MGETFFGKVWAAHLVDRRIDGRDLIYIDRHVLHDRHAPIAFRNIEKAGRGLRRPDLTFAVQDHTISTRPGRDDLTNPAGTDFLRGMREGSRRYGVRLFDVHDPEQGISHVVAPELGIVLPGATHAVPDSHAPTVGGVGAVAFGSGTTEMEHILVTQVIALRKPRTMRLRLNGRLSPYVSAKDVALFVLGRLSVDGAKGLAVEYSGSLVSSLGIEARMTLCNLLPEMGARTGFVPPDDTTIDWLAGRPWAPSGATWDRAVAAWKALRSDEDAVFDKDVELDCGTLAPQITWGTDPSQVVGVDGRVPEPSEVSIEQRQKLRQALDYMDLKPGQALEGLPIHRVFIGSCTNARLPDLEAAAAVLRGRHVAEGVEAMVVPGSTTVKREAEVRGLDRIFKEAGFFWGESACSMCGGGNGDKGRPGERCVSTTSRNFEGRQGRDVRTHLSSPEMAAAAAVAGTIVDVRKLVSGAK
jgi:3-isopropylmalate/(R)-2-methylmalate dehydratase large subunit